MGRHLILDTNILIAYERGTIDRGALDNDELAVAAITIAEDRVGIELADTAERAAPVRERLSRSPLQSTSSTTPRPQRHITLDSSLTYGARGGRAAPTT